MATLTASYLLLIDRALVCLCEDILNENGTHFTVQKSVIQKRKLYSPIILWYINMSSTNQAANLLLNSRGRIFRFVGLRMEIKEMQRRI